jgi:hypothetical protein
MGYLKVTPSDGRMARGSPLSRVLETSPCEPYPRSSRRSAYSKYG